MKKNIILTLVIVILTSVLLLADVTYTEYKVQPKDTFMSICKALLLDCDANWKQLLEFNGLKKPTDVVAGMTLKIPNSLAKSRYAKVQFIVGNVEVASNLDVKDASEIKFEKIRNNHVLIEKNVLKTGEDGKCEIKLDDGTILKLAEDTVIVLGEINYDKNGDTNTLLKLLGGSVLMKVTKLNDGDKFNVSTPTAVAGVRGTEFTMSVNKNEKVELTVLQGIVATSTPEGQNIIFQNADSPATTQAAATTNATEIVQQGGQTDLKPDKTINVDKGYTVIFDKSVNKAIITKIPEKISNVNVQEVGGGN